MSQSENKTTEETQIEQQRTSKRSNEMSTSPSSESSSKHSNDPSIEVTSEISTKTKSKKSKKTAEVSQSLGASSAESSPDVPRRYSPDSSTSLDSPSTTDTYKNPSKLKDKGKSPRSKASAAPEGNFPNVAQVESSEDSVKSTITQQQKNSNILILSPKPVRASKRRIDAETEPNDSRVSASSATIDNSGTFSNSTEDSSSSPPLTNQVKFSERTVVPKFDLNAHRQTMSNNDIDSPSQSPDSRRRAENIRTNLMSPLNRVRRITARSRSGSSPGRSPAQIRAQVQRETEKLAAAGNVAAKRILHRAASESCLSMNSWDLGYTFGFRNHVSTNEDLFERAHAAATSSKRALAISSDESSLPIRRQLQKMFDSEAVLAHSVSKEEIAERLMAPLKPRPRLVRRSSGGRANSRSSSDHINSSPKEGYQDDSSVVFSQTGSKGRHSRSETIGDGTFPRTEKSNSRRSLASFGRKSSYHQLSKATSGGPATFLPQAGEAPATELPQPRGEARTKSMESFLRFIPSHLSNSNLAEGIVLVHSMVVPSTFMLDHLIQLFRGENQEEDSASEAAFRKEVINFLGQWVSLVPTDFQDDFLLEKKLKDFIVSLKESGKRLEVGYGALLSNIYNQAAHLVESNQSRVLSNTEIIDMANAVLNGSSPGDVIQPVSSIPLKSRNSMTFSHHDHQEIGQRLLRSGSPKSVSLASIPNLSRKESSQKELLERRISQTTITDVDSLHKAPSFEAMVDLSRKASKKNSLCDVIPIVQVLEVPPPKMSKSKSGSKLKSSKSSDSVSSEEGKDKEKDKQSEIAVHKSSLAKSPSKELIRETSSRQLLNASTGISAPSDLTPDLDELSHRPKIGKKLLMHLSDQLASKEFPVLLNVSPYEIAKQWTLLDHQTLAKVRGRDMLLNVSKPSKSAALTEVANRFNHATCWVALQILRIPNLKKRALAITHLIAVAEQLLNLTNLHGFIAIVTGLSQHSISRLHLTWRKVDPKVKKTFDSMVNLASPIGNFSQLRPIHDKALAPFVPTPAMFLKDLLFAIEGNGGSFVQNGIIKTDMILLCHKVLIRIIQSQHTPYRFYGVAPIQEFLLSGSIMSNEELDSLSNKVESARDNM